MTYNKRLIRIHSISFLLAFLFLAHLAVGQSTKQEKMQQLEFMVGEWVGTSTTYKDGAISKQVPAFQNIAYDLNKSIIVIQLNSPSLLLHTIVYYDEKDQTYYYYPFSERGVRQLPAEFNDGRLIVNANENTRYIFESTGENSFREYGEKRTNGEWVKFFEDSFTNTK